MLVKKPQFEISAVSPKQYPKNDLPTFDLPTKTISGRLDVGYCFSETADISNFGFFININFLLKYKIGNCLKPFPLILFIWS